ncbi:hypothetical protein PspLS_06412 [Pyricularia sp. CBS 133598]|nr:hypothetical protein PspLS_06412 [Pyricularia sp. CBS 133598]
MELLASPENLSTPLGKTRYVCTEIWDGDPFLSYASRRGMSRIVPADQLLDSIFADDDTEDGRPFPTADLDAMLQTWLFFGFLAELLNLNRLPDGSQRDGAQEGIAALHAELQRKDESTMDVWLDGARAMQHARLFVSSIKDTQEAAVDERVAYLIQ